MNGIASWWSAWQGELRSALRIVAAAMFMLAGSSKLLAFPIGMPPNGQTASSARRSGSAARSSSSAAG